MADLSPAPQAVLAAALQELEQSDCTGIHRGIAAALRKLAELDGIKPIFVGPNEWTDFEYERLLTTKKTQTRAYRLINAIADELKNHVSEEVGYGGKWLPMESAPTDGTKILAICSHEADSYWDNEPGLTITPYTVWSETEGHVEDGPCVIAWQEGYTEDESGEGWGPWTTMPGWWFETTNCDPPIPANPIGWLPIPPHNVSAPCKPADEELWDLYVAWDGNPEDWEWFKGVAKAVREKWGGFNPDVVPLSERQPSEEDCDDKGRCWYGAPDRPGAVACWDLESEPSTDSTHWLPYWALSGFKNKK